MQFLFAEWQCDLKDGRVGKRHKVDQNLSSWKYGTVWEEDAQKCNLVIRNTGVIDPEKLPKIDETPPACPNIDKIW